jgi:hypothetical protein
MLARPTGHDRDQWRPYPPKPHYCVGLRMLPRETHYKEGTCRPVRGQGHSATLSFLAWCNTRRITVMGSKT